MYYAAFEPPMENCAPRRTEKATSPRLVPQRKAFDLFFCQSHLPFVMDKEKAPSGALPRSAALTITLNYITPYTC